jgi:hypothetical protein
VTDSKPQSLISKVQSPKSAARYEACEDLRVAKTLSVDANRALQTALYDPDPSVAEAAKRALEGHLHHEPSHQDANGTTAAGGPLPFGFGSLIAIAASLVFMMIPFSLHLLTGYGEGKGTYPIQDISILLSLAANAVALGLGILGIWRDSSKAPAVLGVVASALLYAGCWLNSS